jgi:multisubunit Na+/H+ antiporter MnhE subunit
MIFRAACALRLLVETLRAVVVSGLGVILVILRVARTGIPPPSGFVRIHVGPLGKGSAALLGCLVSLTPGTTTLHVDPEAGVLLLHVLDLRRAGTMSQEIRDRFLRPIRGLAGRRVP